MGLQARLLCLSLSLALGWKGGGAGRVSLSLATWDGGCGAMSLLTLTSSCGWPVCYLACSVGVSGVRRMCSRVAGVNGCAPLCPLSVSWCDPPPALVNVSPSVLPSLCLSKGE